MVVRLLAQLSVFPVFLVCLASATHASPDAEQGRESGSGATRLKLDSERSSMVIHTSTEGLLSIALGGNRIALTRFSGDIVTDSAGTSTMTIVIAADSLAVLDKASNKRRRTILRTMRGPVMETDSFPTIRFVSTWRSLTNDSEPHRVAMSGELLLHGVRRSLSLEAEASSDTGVVRLVGECPILHTDYGMRAARFLGGLVRVADEFVLRFDLVGKMAPRAPQTVPADGPTTSR
jgi:polyisoprenoid-binding protein YceI